MSIKKEIFELVQDIKLFLHQEWEEGKIDSIALEKKEETVFSSPTSVSLPTIGKEKKISKPITAISSPVSKEETVVEPTKEHFEKKPLQKPLEKAHSFTLTAMEAPVEKSLEELRNLIKLASPKLHWKEIHIPIVLLLFEENKEHRIFLENVSKAVSQSIAPSKVVFLNSLKELPSCELFLAPSSKVSNLSSVTLHSPIEWPSSGEKKKLFFPLAELDSYIHDSHLKRSLWNSLKALSFKV